MKADRSKIPASLQCLDWVEYTGEELWSDGDEVIAIVPLSKSAEVVVLTMEVDQDGVYPTINGGDEWCRDMESVAWFVKL